MPATTSTSPEQTAAIAENLAARLRPGDLLLLEGDLGTGKTTFTQALCRALGVTGPVTSPTFVIAHRYDSARGQIAHLDLHRLGTAGALDRDLIDAELDAAEVAIVEWPSGAPGLQDRATWRVTLEHGGGDTRHVEVTQLTPPGAGTTMPGS